MSFSGDVKQELCRIPVEKKCCAKAELAGIVAFCGVEQGKKFFLRTENQGVAARARELFSFLFGIEPRTETVSRGAKGKLYLMVLQEDGNRKAILADLGLYRQTMVKFAIDPFLVQETCCARAFLRGAFLGGGSVNSPQKSYHLEIETHYYGLSRDLVALLADLDFEAKTVMRKSGYVLYVKDSDKIGDLLALMGATDSMFDLYNIKIEKDVKNSINRRVNCETANLSKTADAAGIQIQSIRRLIAKRGSDAIPDHLREIAELRLAYPEASLSELGAMLEPPISKSGVNHRLKKLIRMAETL